MGTSQSREEKFEQALKVKLESIYPHPEAQAMKLPSRRPEKLAPQHGQKIKLRAQPTVGRKGSFTNTIDGRTQILATAQWPNSVHGIIVFKIHNIVTWGTGIMIGPNIVLTAGHNLYDYQSKVYAELKNMQFLPGISGQVLPFGRVEVEKYFVSPNYIAKKTEDYGILILKEAIGEFTGYFGLACLEPEEMKGKRINVTGYPYDKVAFKPGTYEMWGMDGIASYIDQHEGIIGYLIDTETGQGGSGVWYQEGEDYYVCGVHVAGGISVNSATLLTRAIYEQIETWTRQVKFKDFSQFGNSKKLEFVSQEITTRCIAILIKYKLDDLNILDLASNNIDADGAKTLAQNVSWINLSKLNLSNNKIGAEGAKSLAQNTSWKNLSHLNVSWNNIGAEGAKALAQSKAWAKSPQSKTLEFKQLLKSRILENIYPHPDAKKIQSPCRGPAKPALQNSIKKVLNAIPIQRNNQNVLNAVDQRKRVHNTRKWPNSVHGVVASKFKNDTCYGTGVLIGPNIVLSAGHNLYNYEDKVYADLQSIQFLPGMDGVLLPFGFVEVEKYFVSPNYIEEAKEDYGILILKKPIGEVTGYFGLACLEPKEVQTKRINVTGYPRDKVASKPKIYEMWGMEGTVSNIDSDKGLINYVIDTGPGQSGSGVWYQDGEGYYVCGVHVAGGISVNSATLLTRAIYEKIYKFVQESTFKDLLEKLENSELNFEDQRIILELISSLNNSHLDNPTYFSLFSKSIDSSETEALAQSILSNLSELDLSGNNIGVEGARALSQNTSWTNLSLLNLSSNNIDTEGVKALAQNTSWISLLELDLSNNKVDKEGKEALRQNKAWKEKNFFL